MNIRELSVGDWVEFEGKPYQVMTVDGSTNLIRLYGKGNPVAIGGLDPLPLTADFIDEHLTPILPSARLLFDEMDNMGMHQLQHALRLVNIEIDVLHEPVS